MRTRFWSFAIAAAAGIHFLGGMGCNAVSGADDIKFSNSDDDDDSTKLYAAPGVAITEIALYQGIKRPLMVGGALATSDIPIVAGRAGMLRVFVSTDASYTGQAVTAYLTINDAETPLMVTQSLTGTSTDDSLQSTLNFDIPGELIQPDFHYNVVLGQTEKSGGSPLAYPAMGSENVGATSAGPTLKIQLVPIKYGADGSNRVPDTSQETQDLFRDGYLSTYPIPNVEITVHEPVVWNQTIAATGQGWDALLDSMLSLRQKDGAAPDQYYFAIFAPKDTFNQFCGGGCVLGLAPLSTGPSDNYSRAGIGVSFADTESVITAIHETGHTHGREHAPCQVDDPDPAYPHDKGEIGVWGYNVLTKQLFPPTTPDFMSYCEPIWISDYTFNALFDRMKAVNKAKIAYPKELLDRTYDHAIIGSDGQVKWAEPVTMHTPPLGEETPVVLENTGGGEQTVKGQLYRFDHLPGGILFWPQSQTPYKAARMRIDAGAKEIRLPR